MVSGDTPVERVRNEKLFFPSHVNVDVKIQKILFLLIDILWRLWANCYTDSLDLGLSVEKVIFVEFSDINRYKRLLSVEIKRFYYNVNEVPVPYLLFLYYLRT